MGRRGAKPKIEVIRKSILSFVEDATEEELIMLHIGCFMIKAMGLKGIGKARS